MPRVSALDEEDPCGSTITAFELDRATRELVVAGPHVLQVESLDDHDLRAEKRLVRRVALVIIEGLDLKDVRPGDYELACGAIKFEGGDGAPARVFLIER